MPDSGSKLKVYISEEQQVLREAYRRFFLSQPDMEVVGCSGDTGGDVLVEAAWVLKPNVMLLGFKILQSDTVERLDMVRKKRPDVAMVVLSANYDANGIRALREFSRGSSVGCSYLLKHTIDTVEQLTQVVRSVAEGRIILDLAVMEGLMSGNDSNAVFLRELTPREMEVLSWMAKGYRNNTIAEVLCLDLNTVERHINSIYGKLGDRAEQKDARVHAIMLYLKATGLLPVEEPVVTL